MISPNEPKESLVLLLPVYKKSHKAYKCCSLFRKQMSNVFACYRFLFGAVYFKEKLARHFSIERKKNHKAKIVVLIRETVSVRLVFFFAVWEGV